MAHQTKPHIAILPNPGMGHITPHFQLAKILALHHNLNITFLLIPTPQNHYFHSSKTLPPHLTIINLTPTPTKPPPLFSLQNYLTPLKTHLTKLKPNALIIDIFTTEAIELCLELKIQFFSFFSASTVLLAFSLYLPTLDQQTEGQIISHVDEIKVPGCSPVKTGDVLEQVKNGKNEAYDWYLFHASRLKLAAGIFVNSWEDLDSLTLNALRKDLFFENLPTPNVYPIGPLIKDDGFSTEIDNEILTWLDRQRPESVVFVAFGSGGILSEEQLVELAWGLEMSRQRFIWVVRKPTHSTSSAPNFYIGNEANNNDPTSYLPDGFLERTKGFGIVVPTWCTQVAVLRHPSTGGFISHCGWNSTLEGLANGVPIIAWPMHAEQRMNAAFLVEEVGAAVRPRAEEGGNLVRREEVERVVRMVIEGEEGKSVRSRVRELKESASKALEFGGSSFNSLVSFVESLKS